LSLHKIIEIHDPDIILGCESHLDPQISSSGAFSGLFSDPHRKDEASGEGRLFIVTKNDLITTEIQTSSECEINGQKSTFKALNNLLLDPTTGALEMK
jgi:hypothetical protein